MSDKIGPGYVRFYIQNGAELATLMADEFRAAMNERDALRAENERLKHENVGLVADMADIAQQRDQAQAENERLNHVADAAVEQRAELERLRADYDPLRDALEQIAGIESSDPEFYRRIAISALADELIRHKAS